MSKIFEESETVIAWLGDGRSSESARIGYAAAARLRDSRNLEDLGTILGYEYFNRLWVVQEVLLAKNFNILMQDVCIHWQDMSSNVSPTDLWRLSDRENKEEALILFKSRIKPQEKWPHTSYSAFRSESKFECQDPRDRVYGLMLFVPPLSGHLVVDYSRTIDEVFSDVVIQAFALELENLTDLSIHACSERYPLSLVTSMGGAKWRLESLRRFLDASWDQDRIRAFKMLRSPLTSMGFEPSVEDKHMGRQWYAFQERDTISIVTRLSGP
jgi:hypothetical protein